VQHRNELIVRLIRNANSAARTMTRNKETREDWAQEAILNALTAYDKFKQLEQEELLQVMNRIIVNKLINLAASRKAEVSNIPTEPMDLQYVYGTEPEPWENAMVDELVTLTLESLDPHSQHWLRRKWEEVQQGDDGHDPHEPIQKSKKYRIRKRVREQLTAIALFEELPIANRGHRSPRPSLQPLLN